MILFVFLALLANTAHADHVRTPKVPWSVPLVCPEQYPVEPLLEALEAMSTAKPMLHSGYWEELARQFGSLPFRPLPLNPVRPPIVGVEALAEEAGWVAGEKIDEVLKKFRDKSPIRREPGTGRFQKGEFLRTLLLNAKMDQTMKELFADVLRAVKGATGKTPPHGKGLRSYLPFIQRTLEQRLKPGFFEGLKMADEHGCGVPGHGSTLDYFRSKYRNPAVIKALFEQVIPELVPEIGPVDPDLLDILIPGTQTVFSV